MKFGKELTINQNAIFEDLNKNERKTKIIATIGDSCNDVDILIEMIDAGMDIMRFDMLRNDLKVLQ